MIRDVTEVLQNLSPISLEEMDSVSLMKRVDTKFILPSAHLHALIQSCAQHYSVLTIDDIKKFNYASLYFDTSTFKFYHDHHNGRINRFKVRKRKYVESNLCFLEIKKKNNKGVTKKKRVQIDDLSTDFSIIEKAFLNKTIGNSEPLIPALHNNFSRITMVNLDHQERVTIDLNLSFRREERHVSFSKLGIVELKQGKLNRNSYIFKELKTLGYNPYSISKYCIGLSTLLPELKANRFKAKKRRIQKLTLDSWNS